MNFRRLVIVAPSSRYMRWHERLRDSLARRWPGADILLRFEFVDDPQPSSVTQLLTLERLLLRSKTPPLCERLDAQAAQSSLDAQADVIVDLTGRLQAAKGARVLRPLYDGQESDQAAIAALLAGAAPALAVEDAGRGVILTEGLPSLETAHGLTGGLDAVYSRIILLIEMALAGAPDSAATPIAREDRHARKPLDFFLRGLAFQCVRAIYHLCCHSPHWRVGWRFNDGPGVFESGGLAGARWRVLTDRAMGFAADPFPIEWRGRMGVFFESMDYRTNKGAIGFQEFGPDGPLGEPVVALAEPWHLSYPFLISHEGALYMLPEASASKAATLYRCVDFPAKWEPVARLLDGVEAADATIFRHEDRYWMTSVVRDGVGGYSDTLALHYSGSLFGPWKPHALYPALVDSRFARPAGAVVARNGALFRPVQDCTYGYGKGLTIMRIDQLDPEVFHQSFERRIAPGAGWPGDRLHTVNHWGRLECIDGAILTPKPLLLRRIVQNHIDSRGLGPEDAASERPMSLALSED